MPDRRRDIHQAVCHLIGSVPGRDQPVELQNLLLEPAQLSSKCCETHAGYRGNPIVSWIGDGMEQFLNAFASDRRDDPELGKMRPDRIDH